MKIGVKITLLIVISVVGIAVVSILSLSSLSTLNDLFTDIGDRPVKNLRLANEAVDNLNNIARQTALICIDTVDKNSKLSLITTVSDELWLKIDTLHGNVVAENVVIALKNFEESVESMRDSRIAFEDAVKAGDIAKASLLRTTSYADGINKSMALATELTLVLDGQVSEAAYVTSNAEYDSASTLLMITIAVIIILLVVVAVVIITGITKPLKRAVEAANKVSDGDINVDLQTNSKDETGTLMHALENMVHSIGSVIKDTDALSHAAISGQLEVRSDVGKHKGAYKELVSGINKTLDAVIGPLNMTAEYVDRISKGDIPPKITDNYNGDFNEIKNNLNGCIDAIGLLVSEINHSITAASDGNLQYRADANKHQGDFRKIMIGVNSLVVEFVEPLEIASKFLVDVSGGDKNMARMTKEVKGDFNVLKNAINTTHATLFDILDAIIGTATEARNGQLDRRADTSKVKGAWVEMLEGLNGIVEAAGAITDDAGHTLEIMATGDLTPRITKNYPGKFGDMKNNINNLGDALTDLISQLQDAIHTTASASAQISSTADTLAAATQEQSSQTDEVASAMEEMSRTVTDNAHSAVRTSDVAKQSGEVANNGGKVVRQTVEKMREIAAVVKTSADNIAKLGESSKKIGEIISVIDDIADQTNLLSLNAAIEAARAGEQGRGFAVVADSVGKLAISTASATKEIADMIKGIQNDTEAAVKAMEKGTNEVQSGIELADNAGNSLQDILAGINELLDMVNQIAAASEQQSATSEQISKNVSSISKVTADSAKNIEDVATTANELAKMTNTLTSLVSQFKVNAVYHSSHAIASSNDRYLGE